MKEENNQEMHEQEIDLMELAQKVWKGRKLIFRVCGIAAVVGLIAAFSIPREYSASAMLAPEVTSKSGGASGMGALAAMAGINLPSGGGKDAIMPDLYPDIVSSIPFLTGLFEVEVKSKNSAIDTTLYAYMLDDQKSAWWSTVMGLPFKTLGWVMSLFKEKEEDTIRQLNPFQLTPKEMAVVNALQKRISVSVDKKLWVTTIHVTMQDPLIAATLTDTVMKRLQEYVTEYRTNKARYDLEYTEDLYVEAQKAYYDAQQKYAAYTDGNQNIVLRSFRTEQERLQNEMNLAFNIYNQVAQQLQLAKSKVMEITPVYAVVKPATVPLNPVKPKKAMMLIGFIFLGGVGSVAWILFGKDFFAKLRGKKSEDEEVNA